MTFLKVFYYYSNSSIPKLTCGTVRPVNVFRRSGAGRHSTPCLRHQSVGAALPALSPARTSRSFGLIRPGDRPDWPSRSTGRELRWLTGASDAVVAAIDTSKTHERTSTDEPRAVATESTAAAASVRTVAV